MQPLDLKVLDLELPHHRPSDRQPTYRQGTNGAGSNGHRSNRGRPNASRCQLHRRTLLPAAAKHGKGSGRSSLGVHGRVLLYSTIARSYPHLPERVVNIGAETAIAPHRPSDHRG